MFTGIIEEQGRLEHMDEGADHFRISIAANRVLQDVHIGDSIAVNGVCLTVTHFSKDQFTVDVMPETVKATSLRILKKGSPVNLERAMQANGRFGGHIMSGHVDGVGRVISKKKDSNAIYFWIEADLDQLKYIVPKGSIAVDGISLTVIEVKTKAFSISIIPHTLNVTTLQSTKIGDPINLECDVIAKYIEGLLKKDHLDSRSPGLSLETLQENGYA